MHASSCSSFPNCKKNQTQTKLYMANLLSPFITFFRGKPTPMQLLLPFHLYLRWKPQQQWSSSKCVLDVHSPAGFFARSQRKFVMHAPSCLSFPNGKKPIKIMHAHINCSLRDQLTPMQLQFPMHLNLSSKLWQQWSSSKCVLAVDSPKTAVLLPCKFSQDV